jgi:hypothetical protein
VRFRAAGLSEPGLARVRAIAREVAPSDDGWWRANVRAPEDVPLLARALVESGARLEALVPEHETLEQAFLRLVGVAQPAPQAGAAAGFAARGGVN